MTDSLQRLTDLTVALNKRDEELEKAESIYEAISRSVPGCFIVVFDADLNISIQQGSSDDLIDQNKHATRVHDIAVDIITHPNTTLLDACTQALNGTPFIGEVMFGSKRRLTRIEKIHRKTNSSTPWGGMATFLDISELHQLKSEATETKQKYDLIFNRSSNFLCLLSKDLIVINANEVILSLFGLSKWNMVGQHVTDVVMSKISDIYQTLATHGFNVALSGKSYTTILEFPTADGQPVAIDFVFSPILDIEGNVSHLLLDGHIADPHLKLEDRMQQVETVLNTLKSIMTEAMVVDKDGIIIDANDAFIDLFGFATISDVIGTYAHNVIIGEDINSVLQKVQDNYMHEYVTTGIKPTGEKIPVRIRKKKSDTNELRIAVILEDTDATPQ